MGAGGPGASGEPRKLVLLPYPPPSQPSPVLLLLRQEDSSPARKSPPHDAIQIALPSIKPLGPPRGLQHTRFRVCCTSRRRPTLLDLLRNAAIADWRTRPTRARASCRTMYKSKKRGYALVREEAPAGAAAATAQAAPAAVANAPPPPPKRRAPPPPPPPAPPPQQQGTFRARQIISVPVPGGGAGSGAAAPGDGATLAYRVSRTKLERAVLPSSAAAAAGAAAAVSRPPQQQDPKRPPAPAPAAPAPAAPAARAAQRRPPPEKQQQQQQQQQQHQQQKRRARAEGAARRAAERRGLCMRYCRTGACALARRGACPHVHDPAKVAVCLKWATTGSCAGAAAPAAAGAAASSSCCPLQHRAAPELMPVCVHFLKVGVSSEHARSSRKREAHLRGCVNLRRC